MKDERRQTDGQAVAVAKLDFLERFTRSMKKREKKLLPKAVSEEIRRYRTCQGKERSLYLKIRLLNGIGLMNPKRSRVPATARSFVFVCFGNIMRSPMCEALMTRALAGVRDKGIKVTSAGLNAVPGRGSHPWAITAAQEMGISLENHRARCLTAEVVDHADVVFAMDYQNQAQLFARYAGARNKVFMLSAYAGKDYKKVEISDPYYAGQEGTRHCFKILDACIRNLVCSLFAK